MGACLSHLSSDPPRRETHQLNYLRVRRQNQA
jgi:hypothetical protein